MPTATSSRPKLESVDHPLKTSTVDVEISCGAGDVPPPASSVSLERIEHELAKELI